MKCAQVAASGAGFLCSCATALVEVPRGAHPLVGGAEPVVVDSKPPPAQIDELPSARAPAEDCAWADGRYTWEDNRWVWQPGRWVRLATVCYYADSLFVWVPSVGNGVLFYTHGQWYRYDGQGMCPPPDACESETSSVNANSSRTAH
jgi:hypothetical protein